MEPAARQFFAVSGMLLVTVVWGLSFILIKWTIAEMDLYYFLFVRFAISFVLMLVFFGRRVVRATKGAAAAGAILGALFTVVYITQTEGLRFTTASNSAMITGLYMVMIPLISALFLKKRPGAWSVAGVVIALPGLYLLTNCSIGGANIGDALTLVTAAACAFHVILIDRYARMHSVFPLVAYQFAMAAVASLAVMLAKGAAFSPISEMGWITILVCAVFGTVCAFIIQVLAQRVIDPTRTGIIFAMEAVFGALFGYWLGGESMTAAAFAGACLMVAGMVLSEVRPLARWIIDKIV